MKIDKTRLSLYAHYFTAYLAVAIQTSFLNLYLNNAGIPNTQIGIINGIVQILTLVAAPIFGKAADKSKTKNSVLIFGLIITCISLYFFNYATTPKILAIFTIEFLTIYIPLQGIYESITVETTSKNKWEYAPIRMTGTISYGIMSYICGLILDYNDSLIFPIFLAVMILNTITAFFLPKVKAVQVVKNDGKHKENVYVLLKNKRIRNVLILFFLYTLGSTVNSSYYAIYMVEVGGNYNLVGIANFILAMSEIPWHIGKGAKWLKKIGIEKSMLLMASIGIVRWIIVGLCNNPYLLMFTTLLNGIMLVPTIDGLVEFINEEAPENLKASAQTGLKLTFQLLGQLFINIFGGIFVGYIDSLGYSGIRWLYLLLSPIHIILTIVIGISTYRNNKKISE